MDKNLVANLLECQECGETQFIGPGIPKDCPNDPEHVVDFLHTSKEPLGWDDDDDHYHHSDGEYQYPAERPAW